MNPSSPLPRRAFVSTLAGAAVVLGAAAIVGMPVATRAAAETAVRIPPPADAGPGGDAGATSATAVFAGGCFWGVQGVFQHTRGVLNAVSGYTGGSAATARYELIGSGLTGHAEAVQVTYDPRQVTYAQLLQIFFSVVHDPTQLNRQGPDRGTQYRSAIFTTDAAQKQAAERYIAQLDAARVYPGKIATQVGPLVAFHPAEDYHQDYATLHPESRYIATFDLPKIVALKTMFAAQYRAEPVLVRPRSATARR
jgi:peptide-methionine (S)-S-oxide reductase